MNSESFEAAVSRLLDGDISPEDFSELERYLEGSAEARARYMEFVDLHNVLDLELSMPGAWVWNTSPRFSGPLRSCSNEDFPYAPVIPQSAISPISKINAPGARFRENRG